MQKLKLRLESLQVESFEASSKDGEAQGTVKAHLAPPTPPCSIGCSVDPYNSCHTCIEVPSCLLIC